MQNDNLIGLTADIVSAFVANNPVQAGDLPGLIASTYSALDGAGAPAPVAMPTYIPAVNPRKSVKPDHLISLIDGKPYKMLKRHLALHGLSPEEYRTRYGLAPDYPMVAANYAEKRRDLAKKIGLGRKPGQSPAKRKG